MAITIKDIRKDNIKGRILPYDMEIAEKYKLTHIETLLYGLLWKYLSRNCSVQIMMLNKEFAEILKSNKDAMSAGINKLIRFGIIKSIPVTDKKEGGQYRYISWENFSLIKQKKRNYDITPTEKSVEPPTEKSVVPTIYNNNNINNKLKDNSNSISDNISSNIATTEKSVGGVGDKKPVTLVENQSKIKMSSIGEKPIVKKKREFNEKEKEVFSIYKKLVWESASKEMKIVKEGIPRVLKVFDTPKDFKQAVLNMLNDKKYWKAKLDTEITRRAPNPFLKQSFLESYLLPMLYIKKKQDFSDDEDVKLVYKHNQEALKKILS